MRIFYKTLYLILSMSVFAFTQTNVIVNGGMENWTAGLPDNWTTNPGYTATQNSDTTYAGLYAAKILLTVISNPNMGQINIPINGGDHYILQMRVYDNDPSGRVRFWGYWEGASGGPNPSFYTSDTAGWQLYEYEIDAPSTATGLELQIRFYDDPAWDGNAIFYIDEVKVLAPASNLPQFSNITVGLFYANTPGTIEATITDDQGISSAYLHYRINLAAQDDSVQMINISGDIYQAIIPGQGHGTGIEYWISATDTDVPSNYSTSPHYQVMVGITNIEKSHEIDSNGNMLYEGYLVKVRGIVTAATGTFSQNGNDDYIQDLTGGVNIYNSSVIQAMALGDSVEISGKFDVYNSKSEIINPIITILNQGNPVPNPIVITTSDMGEQYEGMLIRIDQGAVNNWVSQPSDTSYNATYTTADGDLILRIDGDTDIGGNNAPQGIIDLIGIGSQYDNASPFTEGYQIMPRSWADFLNLNSIEEEIITPYEFALKQNYPNPFNPNTKIEFSLAANSDVKMVIYNLLGQEIRSFYAQNLKAGIHQINWNGIDNKGFEVASGIYIYRLTAGDFVSTKKMALLR